ncbi:MAG TPA: pyridoxine 5'-phosphate synthase [Candidatus Competibacteraceae bacterium]|nr:pyridoxine 5'-phosphate synthase [Candidatus Competibacteraceae bacterium]
MTALSVNLNKVALLRNSRNIGIPSVVEAARICIAAGAHGITVHPRPDQRHIRIRDVYDLAGLLAEVKPVEYNIEGNPFAEFMALVREVRPTQCTLVPDSPEQQTSDHGWDLVRDGERLRPIIAELQALGIRVSLFLDPEPEQVRLAKAVGADRIELYTEPYAAAFARGEAASQMPRYLAAATLARELGLGLNAGHDLNLDNLPPFIRAIPWVQEVSIGHALIADALKMGLHDTVQAYLRALSAA